MNLLMRLPPFDSKSGTLNVVIDTPKGCRSKFAFDMKRKAYVLKSVLPQGTVFPFDFGSIPGTVAEDGDPLDVLMKSILSAAIASCALWFPMQHVFGEQETSSPAAEQEVLQAIEKYRSAILNRDTAALEQIW